MRASGGQRVTSRVTLRATLQYLVTAMALYVAVIAFVVAWRIEPTASALRRRSAAVLAEYQVIERRATALNGAVIQIRPLATGAALPPDSLHARVGRARHTLDSLEMGRSPGMTIGIPTEMRAGLAVAGGQQSMLGGALSNLLAAVELRRAPEAADELHRVDSLADQMTRDLARAELIGFAELLANEQALAAAAAAAVQAMLWLVGIGVLLAAAIVLLVHRRLTEPLGHLDAGLVRIAAGDLGTPIPVHRRDELGQLAGQLNRMMTLLRERAEDERLTREHLTERQQAALVEMAKHRTLRAGDLAPAFRQITETATRILDVERVSVWLYNTDRSAIRCADLYRRGTQQHESGLILRGGNPLYVGALEDGRVLASNDVRSDPRMHDVLDSYLQPSGITATLDAPIRRGGRTVGVVSHEHVGGARVWTAEEQQFAGSVGDIAALALDAADLQEAQAALRDSEARYRAAFEEAAVGLAEVAPDGHFLQVNRRLCEMLGYSAAELLRADFMQLTHPNDVAGDLKPYRDTLAGKLRSYQREKRYIRKDGSTLHIYLTTALVRDGQGNPKYFVSVMEDLTQRKELEQRLLQSQKMDAIGRLAGGVAHDFNNLLSVMLGYVQLVQVSLPDGDSRRADLEEVRRAGARAADLSRQLLAFARKQVIEPRVISLNDLVGAMEQMLRRLIGEDVELVTKLAPDLDAVRVDPGQIEQVILNLAVNARDAMANGGQLLIETTNVTLGEPYISAHAEVAPGHYVQISVSDTGSGMSREVLSRLFEPFFTTKEQGKGTGLGLATCYGIVKQTGGHIWVYSEVGHGSTFKIYLPPAHKPLEPQAEAPRPAPAFGTETILLVEDEAPVRSMVSRMLQLSGYTVLSAGDGAAALEVAAAHRGQIDLLVADVVMPRMGGRKLAEALRKTRPSLRVLYVSGYTEDSAVLKSQLDDGAAFLGKPFEVDALAQRVREVLDHAGAS
jgi:PAS domain S-box-containing protein